MSDLLSIPGRPNGRDRTLGSGHCEHCKLQDFSVLEALKLADDMRQTAQQIEDCVRPLVESFGLDNLAYQALGCLAAAGGTLMLKDLARQVRLDRAKQTRVLDDLEKRGLLQRVRNPQDRRTATVSLTPEGRQLVADANHRLSRVPARPTRFPIPSALVCLMGQHGSA